MVLHNNLHVSLEHFHYRLLYKIRTGHQFARVDSFNKQIDFNGNTIYTSIGKGEKLTVFY